MEEFLRQSIAGGVGMVQLREKNLSDAALLDVALRCARVCHSLGVPFVVNDRLDIALGSGADGVHIGQDDVPAETIRAVAGKKLIVGLSTHSVEQIVAAAKLPVDYIGVGPVHATPTKEGRPPVGLELVRYAAAHAAQPFFAIGGLDPSTVGDVVRAGARGVSLLRWISQARDPGLAARQLLERIEDARRARSN